MRTRTRIPIFVEPAEIDPYVLTCFYCGRATMVDPRRLDGLYIPHRPKCPAIVRIMARQRCQYITSSPI